MAIIAMIGYAALQEFSMPTRNVHLTDRFDEFIEENVRSGRFSNASEMVREGLRLLEQREKEDEAKLEWLRAAAKEGFDAIDRGDYRSFDSREEIAAYLHNLGEEVFAEVKAERQRG